MLSCNIVYKEFNYLAVYTMTNQLNILTPVVNEFIFTFEELALDVDKILSAMGYNNSLAPAEVADTTAVVLKEAPGFFKLRGGYKIINNMLFKLRRRKVSIADKVLETGPVITPHLRKSQLLAIFALTAGDRLEQWSRTETIKGEKLKGNIIDALGSAAVETAAELLENSIAAQAKASGYGITNRYSPGYCNWPVEEQHKLFSLLPDNFCGISLTQSTMMIPVKSVSGIIGIGPEASRDPYECSFCELPGCIRKNIGHLNN